MTSAIEIARAWGLFRVGALAEAESLCALDSPNIEILQLHLWIAIRRGDVNAKRHYGELLAACDDSNFSAIGRAHENVALATLNLDTKLWLIPSKKWAEAEVAYARALLSFIRGSPSSVRNELSVALPQNAEQRVRYAQLRAWAKALNDDFEGQAHLLAHALTIALREDVDRTLIAQVAQSLSHLVREMELGDITIHANALLESIQWPKDATTYQFYALRAMAWHKATCGDWIRALRILNQTLAIAPDFMRRGLIHADRARIREIIPERSAAESSRWAALDCFAQIEWDKANDDESIGVLSSIDALCTEPDSARRIYEYAATKTVSKMSGGGHGRRHEAFREFALSYLTTGEVGIAHAQAAYSFFKRIKYVHRGADCAIRAFELGGGSRWKKRIERIALAFPHSLAACKYQRINAPLQRITGRRREVLKQFATTNRTKRAIGEALGVTETTIRDHIRHIYGILGIESRSQLVRLYIEANSIAYEDSAGAVVNQ